MISIQNLHFSYSNNEVIFNDFKLEIKAGSLFGLIGPNGAGKSTLISLITGLNVPEKGEIRISGKDLSTSRHELLNQLSSVPQEYAFYPKLTVLQNLNFFCRLYKRIENPEANIKKAIELTGLADYQERAAIKQLNKEGTTVLYTSHYMEEIERLCDAIAIIDHGKIVLAGELDELLARDVAFTIQTQREVTQNELEGCTFNSRITIHANKIEGGLDGDEQLMELLALLKKSGHKIEQIEFGKQTLESMYFSLTDKAVRE